MSKTAKIIVTVILLILISVIFFLSYKIYSTLHGYKEAEDLYNNISLEYVKDNESTESTETGSSTSSTQSEAFPVNVDFDALMNQCPDVCGWLYSENTVINYPLVQSYDNDYYLHRLIDGTPNLNGSLFLDFKCYKDFSGKSTVIYGHHMNDGSMLASICDYKDQSYYDAHPVMYLSTPTKNYKVEIFSGFITNSDSSAYTMDFATDDLYLAFISKMKAFSDFTSSVQIGANDKVICLSTCTYEYNDARYVVFGKLVPVM